MNKNVLGSIVFFLALLNVPAYCQVKYWVKFKDKNGTPYSISNPGAFLTEKSILRRTTYNIPFDQTDLPVTPQYVTNVDTVKNVTVLYVSKWMNGVVISIPNSSLAPAALTTINSFPFVSSNSRVRRYKLDLPQPETYLEGSSSARGPRTTMGFDYGYSYKQNSQMNVTCLHEKGYRGQGITIAVMDVGFIQADINPFFDSIRNNGQVLGTRDFVSGGTNVYLGGEHGSQVLSFMAANKPGVLVGSAPMASYWLLRTEDGGSETISEEYNWIRAAEFADSVGVDLLTTSLGYSTFDDPSQDHKYADLNGKTAPMSIAATMAARKGMFVLNAAGNEGGTSWKYVSVPGDADSICTVGAIDSLGAYGIFSSVGPTSDGRIKPDLVVRGVYAWAGGVNATPFRGNGTSYATPLLAGAVACYWQANRAFNNITLLNSLRRNANNAYSPNNLIGWGIPDVCKPVLEELDFDFTVFSSANSVITINLAPTNYQSVSIEIVDLFGKILFSKELKPTDLTTTIDGEILADNIYLVKVKTSKGTKTKKIIKR